MRDWRDSTKVEKVEGLNKYYLLISLDLQFVQLEQNGIWENGKRTGKYQMSGARVGKVVRRSPGFRSGQELQSARDNSRANGVKLGKKPSVSVRAFTTGL